MTTAAQSRAWRAHRRKLGLCPACPNPVAEGATYCVGHLIAKREANRARGGYQPWRPGHRGRPPKVRP